MYVLGIDGDLPPPAAERLVGELAERGRVGVVERPDRQTGVEWTESEITVRARVNERGEWRLSGDDGSIEDTLDDLATRCEYAVVYDLAGADWPTLTVVDGTATGELVAAPTAVENLEMEVLIDELEGTVAWETLESLVARAKRAPAAEYSGAIATFTGRVRAKEDPEDVATESLEFDRYGDVANEQMARIREELCEREGIHEVLLHHREGLIRAGEDIVFVVVLAGHREEAFRTVEDGINRLKAEVPIFKKEVTVDEEFWVHNRP